MDNTVFMAADYEAQKLANKFLVNQDLYGFVRKHFLYTFLLSDKVYIPAANYFQSVITQQLVKEFKIFFQNEYVNDTPVIQFSISQKRNSFLEDAEDKINTYPKVDEYRVYENLDKAKNIANGLDGIMVNRRSGTLRQTLKDIIIFESSEKSSLWKKIYNMTLSEQDTNRTFLPIIEAVNVQKYAIVPEYVKILASVQKSTESDLLRMEYILLKAYSTSCEKLYNAFCNNPLYIYYDPIFKETTQYTIDVRETNLFSIFLENFSKLKIFIEKADPIKILQFKFSSEFICFREYYFEFVDLIKKKSKSMDRNEINKICKHIFNKDIHLEKENFINEILNQVYTQNLALLMYLAIQNIFRKSSLARKNIGLLNLEKYPIVGLLKEIDENFFDEYESLLFQKYRQRYVKERVERKDDMRKKIKINVAKSINTTIIDNSGEKNTVEIDNSGEKDTVKIDEKIEYVDEKKMDLFISLHSEDIKSFEKYVESIHNYSEELMTTECKEELKDACKVFEELIAALKSKDDDEIGKSYSKWGSMREKISKNSIQVLSNLANIASIGSFFHSLFVGG